jgi:4'-phosphopantetheinyl transferase
MLPYFPLLDDCVLQTNQIDLWVYPLHDENIDTSLLNAREKDRANRFYFAKHRRRFTNAHRVLRQILSRYLNTSPCQLEFIEGNKGKPALLNHQHLQFNLSHSGDTAVLAVSETYPMGVDIEHFSARPYYDLGRHLFSARENESLQGVNSCMTALTFFNIWVQKEALIKACGMGMSYPTQQFDVPILSHTPQTIADTLHQRDWEMLSFMPQPNCYLALCYDPHIQHIRYTTLTEAQLDAL